MNQTQEKINKQISVVSHEIRNNLSICDMYTQIIKRNLEKNGIENESIQNALNCIQKSVQIIESNILNLKSINETQSKVYDFESTVLKGIELGKAYIVDKNISIEYFIKNSANILINENQYLSCIVNIIKNGIEAIEIKGNIKVFGEIKNNNAVLRISNNGKPIPKSKQNDIFNVGYTTKKTGSGLGLDICRKYLQSQNATLKLVKSTMKETVFEISIPICEKK